MAAYRGDVPEAEMKVSGSDGEYTAENPVDRYNGVALISGEILVGVLSRKKNSANNIKRISEQKWPGKPESTQRVAGFVQLASIDELPPIPPP